MDISMDILTGIKAAEEQLAKEENKELEQIALMFPEDHPIREEYNKHKMNMGDLSSMPATHPFITALKDVKKRMDAADNPEEQERQTEQERQDNDEQRENRRKVQQQERVKEEQDREIRRMASNQLNIQIGKVSKNLTDLYATMESVKDELSGDPYTRSKLVKLERMATAMKRALDECKISSTRMM